MIDVQRHEQRDWERRGYRVFAEAASWWGVTIYMALPSELREMGIIESIQSSYSAKRS